ncbi:MAG: HAMP domain-containing sensor histidine kinase [Muribaculaceae bacterium]
MSNIYDKRRIWKLIFFVVSFIVAALFLRISNNLVKDLSAQERDRMEIWANATKEIATGGMNNNASTDTLGNPIQSFGSGTNIDFLLSIIEGNHNIPVLLVDDKDNILLHRNFIMPEPIDSLSPYSISPINEAFLNNKLSALKGSHNKILINIDGKNNQCLYYEDSTILKKLAYYPYIQLAVMLVFIIIVYFAVASAKKAEQNKVWVGLSKETAHQLGTPISSLMAWMQMLEMSGVEKEIVSDMDKDVHRLSVIADRFSKIGSKPEMELAYINEAISESLGYMKSRISDRIELTLHLPKDETGTMLCLSLFEWVMENITKNAVDAMQGVGKIDVYVTTEKQKVFIDITDTGKGIAHKNFKTVFNPGYTTKKRGWGLGLTLVKRIIEEYHNGKIYVKESEIDNGTTFRIELPKV